MELNNKQNMLPEGWCWASLEDIVVNPKSDIVDGPFGSNLKASEYIETGVPIIRIQNVDRNSFVNKNIKFISNEKARELKRHNFQSGDIVITKLGDPLGKACILPEGLNNGIIVADIVRLRLGHNLCSVPYLVYAINSDSSVQQLLINVKGTTRPRVNLDSIRSLKVPLAPLNEQKRIVAKVEELLERVNVVRKRLARVKEILKRFHQSVLSAAYSGRLTENWRKEQTNIKSAQYFVDQVVKKRKREYEDQCKRSKVEGIRLPKKLSNIEPREVEASGLPKLADEWVYMYLPYLGYMNRGKSQHRPRNAPHLYNGPYPFIQTGDIAQAEGKITRHWQTYSEAGLVQSRLWPAGTVCITIAANIANSAILTYPACFPDSVVGVIADLDLCLAEYLEYFIRTVKADLNQFAPATSQKNINIAILSDVAVPLSPLPEQKEIVWRVEELFKLASAIEKSVLAADKRAEILTQAILTKAFSGELVPTEAELAQREGRSYETTGVLLQRIKKTRE